MYQWTSKRCCVFVFAGLFLATVLAYLTLFLLQADNSAGTRASPSLQFLVVVSHHGNRRPLNSFPSAPHFTDHWYYGPGELTNYGRTQMYNLGVKIRSLYNGFLSARYCKKELYATSAAIEQTLLSGEVFLAGLFPPKGFQLWNKHILWQPTPLYTNSLNTVCGGQCPRLQQERNISSTEYLEENADAISVVECYLKKYLGENMTGINLLYNVWNTLSSEETEGFYLPEWTKRVYPEPLNNLISKMFVANSSATESMTRLVVGKYIGQIIKLIKKKVKKILNPDSKIYFYSDHDITIVSLQAALGIPKSSIIGVVNPGSAMIFELHQEPNTSNYSVQVLYIDGSLSDLEPVPINIPGCSPPCDYNQLVNITFKFWNCTNYKKECQLNHSSHLNM